MAVDVRPPSVHEVFYLSPTRPVAVMLWAFALLWLAYLVIQPDTEFAHLHAGPLIQSKALWVYPTLGATILPPLVVVNGARWAWLAWFRRVYMVGWSWGLFGLTFWQTTALVPYWGVALLFALAAIWLLIRFVTRGSSHGPA